MDKRAGTAAAAINTVREKPKVNAGYLAASKRYRIARFVSLLMAVLCLLWMFSFYHEELTVENLRYLLKYLDTSSPEYTGVFRTIYYAGADVSKVGLYKGELAAVSSTTVDLYNMMGNNTLSYYQPGTQPVLVTGNRYMLVYSIGDNSFAVNNAFSRLHSETLEYPVTAAAMSDSGMFAVVSKTIKYRSAIYFYDRNFTRISRVFKDKLITGIDINPTGTYAAIASAYAEGGGLMCELMVLNPYSDYAVYTETIKDVLPICLAYADDGSWSVCFDDHIRFYDPRNNLLSEYGFRGRTPVGIEQSGDRTVLVFDRNIVGNALDVTVFNTDGSIAAEVGQEGRVMDIACQGDAVWLLYDNSITRITISEGKSVAESAPLDGGCLHVVPKDSMLLICRSHHADPVDPEKLFPSESEGDIEGIGGELK